MKTSFVVVRHGQTEWNVAGRIQGHGDSPLTELGVRQAEAMARRLSHDRFDMVVSSDLGRAAHTARIIAAPGGRRVMLHPGLRERAFGTAEGTTYAQVAGQHPEMFSRERETDPDYAPEGGESRQQHLDRVRSTLVELAGRHVGGQVLVVTHGGVLSCVYRWLHGIPAAASHPIDIPNVGYNLIGVDEGLWSVRVWGDVSHLEGIGVTAGA